MSSLTCYIIAGEVSGDKLGASIMRELKTLQPGIQFFGVGGPNMQAEGLESLFPYDELALMGFVEVLPKMLHLLSRIDQTVEHIEFKQPDIVVTIDSPGFNFRVVKKARNQNIQAKFVHVVAPTVWAYKEKRVHTCAKLFDHMLVLLPFEPPYFEKVGLSTTFIGHPSVAINQPHGDGEAFRKRHHISSDQTLMAILPGSRENEIKRHMPIISQAVDIIAEEHPDIVLVSSAPAHMRATLSEYFMTSPHRTILTFNTSEKMDAFAAANVALVKSGTVSLEMAYADTPMVVMYKGNLISAMIAGMLMKIPYVSLVNILLNQSAIPEYLQHRATAKNLAQHIITLLHNPSKQQQQKEAFKQAIAMLRKDGNIPAKEAAQIICDLATK